MLENVKGLRSNNKGNTLRVILKVLREDLGYHVPNPQILNTKDFGLPQNRERIFIVGFANKNGMTALNLISCRNHFSLQSDIQDF